MLTGSPPSAGDSSDRARTTRPTATARPGGTSVSSQYLRWFRGHDSRRVGRCTSIGHSLNQHVQRGDDEDPEERGRRHPAEHRGAKCASRRSAGSAVFGGMATATLLGNFVVPALYEIGRSHV